MSKLKKRDDVYNVESGEVLLILTTGAYGIHVYVRHDDGSTAMYAHLEEVYIKVGDVLEAGAVLGKIGNSGYSLNDSEKHLHISYFSKRARALTSEWSQDPTFWIKLNTYPTNTIVTNPYRSNRFNKTVKNPDGTPKLRFHEGIDFSFMYPLEGYEDGVDALYQDYMLKDKYPEYYDEGV